MSDATMRVVRRPPRAARRRAVAKRARPDPHRPGSELRGGDRDRVPTRRARLPSESTCPTSSTAEPARGSATITSWRSSEASRSAITWAPDSSSPTRSAGVSTTTSSGSSRRAASPWVSATGSRPWCDWGSCPASTATTGRRGRRWHPTTVPAIGTPGSRSSSIANRRASGRGRSPRMEVPARHGEGKFLAGHGVLERLEAGRQIVARYAGPDGAPTEEWPWNPNGSPGAVAGICDPGGRLFGLMPHPDAYLEPFHHPRWTRARPDGPLPAEGRRDADLPERCRRRGRGAPVTRA